MSLQKGEGRYEVMYQTCSVVGRADEFDAWVTRPDHAGRFPALLVCHDFTGVTPHIKELARVFSRMGYATFVPNLFYRIKDLPFVLTEAESHRVADLVPDGRMRADLEDTLLYMQSFPTSVDASRMAILGFGEGARWAHALAAEFPLEIRAIITVHPSLGAVTRGNGEARVPTVLEHVDDSTVPVLSIMAGDGEVSSDEEIQEYKDKLGMRAALFTYKNAKQGFLDEQNPVYDESSLQDAYVRMLDFLDTCLGGGKPA